MARPKKNIQAQTPAKKIQALPGVFDIVTDNDPLWDIVMKRFERFARNFGFAKVEFPFIDFAEVFRTTDSTLGDSLVHFDMHGKDVALRSHLLPQALRAYHAAKIPETTPLSKWAFAGQTIRMGNKHQLVTDVQFGFEVFGDFTHLTEAQVMGAAWEFVASLGLTGASLEINNTGNAESQRQYQSTLSDFLKSRKYDLCDNCVELLVDRSLQIFRCNELECQAIISEAPVILDFLDEIAKKHFTNILEALEELQIPYQLNPLYVGSTGTGSTSFSIKYKNKQVTTLLGEGAYHTEMSRELTGKPYNSFGFTGSLNTIYNTLKHEQVEVQRENRNEVYLVPLGELAAKKSLRLFRDLITAKISVYDHFGNVGVKSQLKAAQDSKSPIALIMGQKEAMDEMVILRDVKSGMQEMFHYEKIVDEVKKRLGK